MGRPSIDPELMIRMLIVGYVFAIRSERLICREVQVNLAYRWFCKLGIEDAIPDHSAFSRARNERFRDGDVFAGCSSASSRPAPDRYAIRDSGNVNLRASRGQICQHVPLGRQFLPIVP
jgi:hypothetical protein